MFITVTEITEDDDDVLHSKQVALNPLHIARFQSLEEEPEQTLIETILSDEPSMIVSDSFATIWSKIKEALG